MHLQGKATLNIDIVRSKEWMQIEQMQSKQ